MSTATANELAITPQQVAEVAYRIYQEEGCPPGHQLEHWVRAERMLRGAAQRPVVRISHEGGCTRVKVLNHAVLELQDHRRELVVYTVNRLLDELPRPELLLDLEEVESLSAAMLDSLVAIDQRLRSRGGHLRLVNLQPTVREELEITRLDRLLT